jgi:hypothetical protein
METKVPTKFIAKIEVTLGLVYNIRPRSTMDKNRQKYSVVID